MSHMPSSLPPVDAGPQPDAACASRAAIVTRHPIFDIARKTIGYELLSPWPDDATPQGHAPADHCRQTIHQAMHVIGLDTLLGDTRLFIPVAPDNLLQEDYALLPPARTCLKFAQDTPLTPELLDACQAARQAGFGLAVESDPSLVAASPILPMAQYLHVDLHHAQPAAMKTLLALQNQGGPALLAQHIDTHDDLAHAATLGARYVQGCFFSQPQSLTDRQLTSSQVVRLRFLTELARPALNFNQLEATIKSDVALMHHLLRYMNSAALGMRQKISSVSQALVLLGERPVRKWGSLVAITTLADDKPHELLVTSLVRAHFCEGLSRCPGLQNQGLELFLVGLFSTLDAMLGVPMNSALASLPVSEEVKAVLQGQAASPLGKAWSLVTAVEKGLWASVNQLGQDLFLPQHEIASLYYQTLRQTDAMLRPAA